MSPSQRQHLWGSEPHLAGPCNFGFNSEGDESLVPWAGWDWSDSVSKVSCSEQTGRRTGAAPWRADFVTDKEEARRLVTRLHKRTREREMFGIWIFWKTELSGFAGGIDGSGEKSGVSRGPPRFLAWTTLGKLPLTERAELTRGKGWGGWVWREYQELVIVLREPYFLHGWQYLNIASNSQHRKPARQNSCLGRLQWNTDIVLCRNHAIFIWWWLIFKSFFFFTGL